MQARGKGLPQTYDAALEMYNRCRNKWRGRIIGNYRIAVSDYDRNEDKKRPIIGVWYHATEVATFYPDGSAEFTMGCWDTVSTRTVIGSVLGKEYGVSLGSASVDSIGTCAFFRRNKMHQDDRCWWNRHPIETRTRYRVVPDKPGELWARSYRSAHDAPWQEVKPVIFVPRARPLPKSRNTILTPKLGDAFLDTKTGNAYIWTTSYLYGCRGRPVFAVPYHGEHAVGGRAVETHRDKPYYPVVLSGIDFDVWLLAEDASSRVPIDRTKGGVYAYQG